MSARVTLPLRGGRQQLYKPVGWTNVSSGERQELLKLCLPKALRSLMEITTCSPSCRSSSSRGSISPLEYLALISLAKIAPFSAVGMSVKPIAFYTLSTTPAEEAKACRAECRIRNTRWSGWTNSHSGVSGSPEIRWRPRWDSNPRPAA